MLLDFISSAPSHCNLADPSLSPKSPPSEIVAAGANSAEKEIEGEKEADLNKPIVLEDTTESTEDTSSSESLDDETKSKRRKISHSSSGKGRKHSDNKPVSSETMSMWQKTFGFLEFVEENAGASINTKGHARVRCCICVQAGKNGTKYGRSRGAVVHTMTHDRQHAEGRTHVEAEGILKQRRGLVADFRVAKERQVQVSRIRLHTKVLRL